MKATAVIGACFGDEGKGLMVDYLCRKAQEPPLVVRYNGGAQAGHTVVTAQGQRHVFHHYGAGTLAGADTYLHRHFLVNPVAWRDERDELRKISCQPKKLFVHPGAMVTTVYDMLINQQLETSRGNWRHGSCGLGIHETMVRHNVTPLRVLDLDRRNLIDILLHVQKYALLRLHDLRLDTEHNKAFLRSDAILGRFLSDCALFCDAIEMVGGYAIADREIIFEGAQGLMLDEHARFFPYVTHSRPGLPNILDTCNRNDIANLDVVYTLRSYLTRHGEGPLPGVDPTLRYADTTNVENEWQGSLRFAPQDANLLNEFVCGDISNIKDFGGIQIYPSLAVTHCDQYDGFHPDIGISIKYLTYGPTANNVLEQPCQTLSQKSPPATQSTEATSI